MQVQTLILSPNLSVLTDKPEMQKSRVHGTFRDGYAAKTSCGWSPLASGDRLGIGIAPSATSLVVLFPNPDFLFMAPRVRYDDSSR